jgi:hypothetical protein
VTADGYFPASNYAWFNGYAEQPVYQERGMAGNLRTTVIQESSGETIVGATVAVQDPGGAVMAGGITDSEGVFGSAGLPAAESSIIVVADGYSTYRASSGRVNGPTELTLSMIKGPPSILSLTLLDWLTRQPISGATVRIPCQQLGPSGVHSEPFRALVSHVGVSRSRDRSTGDDGERHGALLPEPSGGEFGDLRPAPWFDVRLLPSDFEDTAIEGHSCPWPRRISPDNSIILEHLVHRTGRMRR